MVKAMQILMLSLVSVGLLVTVSFAAITPYVGVQLGATLLDDSSNDYNNIAFSFDSEYDPGFNVGTTGGIDFGMARVEAELTYRQNDVDTLQTGGISYSGDGDISALSLMANGFFDIDTNSPVTPYIGAGIGFANVSMNDVTADGAAVADDDDTVFAYQFGLGVAFDLNNLLALDVGYRYFATLDPEFTDADGDTFESEYGGHNLDVGLRIKF